MTSPRTETQAALDHFVGKVVKARYSAPSRDAEDVMKEIAQDFAILIADMNDAKADAGSVPSKRDVKHIGDNLHNTVLEAFADTNAAIEALQSFIDPNEEHKLDSFEYGLARTH